jgi:hypothetical protein
MSCGCCKILPVDATFNCGTGVTLALNADVSGTWRLRFRFNGIWITRSFAATAGQPFALPELFEQNYVYALQLIKPDGSLFNDVCYVFSGSCGAEEACASLIIDNDCLQVNNSFILINE